MSRKTFKGGVHPHEHKWTEDKAIETMPLPSLVIIPMLQHIGAPAEPVVQKGDAVVAGQVIGEAKKFVSVPVHASISGKVAAVEPRPHPLGTRILSVVIEGDGSDNALALQDDAEYMNLPIEEMKKRILNAGIAGMGGAAFPTHVKLSPPPEKKIDCLVINGAECEPFLTSDHRMMLEHPDEILSGVKLLKKILDVDRVIIGVESNKPDAIRLFSEKVAGDKGIRVQALTVKYPQGGEKQLIKAVTGREVPSGGLPMDIGCLVQNIGTTYAVYEAVRFQKPLIERVVTVTGPGLQEPKNIRARIGTPFKELVAFCGGMKDSAGKLINGGPMMGISQITDEIPVIKGTSGILVLDTKTANQAHEKPCISCGRCVDICPMKLMPNSLASLIEFKKYDTARSQGLFDCMECGSCSYICPAKRNLVHYIKLGKAVCTEKQKKAS